MIERQAQQETTRPQWVESTHMLPDHSGAFLCWCAKTEMMWVGHWNDRGGHDTWGDARQMGWVGGGPPWPTHWAEQPEAPARG